MYLTLVRTPAQSRWAIDGRLLPPTFSLQQALTCRRDDLARVLTSLPTDTADGGALVAPLDGDTEVWGSGVTYQRSWEARHGESSFSVAYDRVYAAERPELFFKALGWRVVGDGASIRVRSDSGWNVPEPELVVVVNAYGEIVGYCAGNDVTSRSIEAENPLYLPQAKIYDGSCALGPGLRLLPDHDLGNLPIELTVSRDGRTIFQDRTSTAAFNRPLEQLVEYLFRELRFPHGVFLMTGTGIVPPPDFTLTAGDGVEVRVNGLMLSNQVGSWTSET